MNGKLDSVTPSQVREVTYSEKKQKIDFRSHLWAYLVIRPLSFYIAPFFLRAGTTANQITGLGFGILILAFVAVILSPQYSGLLIAGALLVNVWYLLDFVDGCVARYTNQGSLFGGFLDWFVGVVYHIGLPITVGLALFQSGEFSALESHTELPITAGLWLVIASIDAIAQLFRKAIAQKIKTLLPETDQDPIQEGVSLTMLAGAFSSFKPPLFLLAALVSAIDLWLLLYFMFNIAVLGPQLLLKSKQLRQHN